MNFLILSRYALNAIVFVVGIWQLSNFIDPDLKAILPSSWWHLVIVFLVLASICDVIYLLTKTQDALHKRKKVTRFVLCSIPAILVFFTVIYLWQIITVGFAVPEVLLPAPSQIYEAFTKNSHLLWDDFIQTIVKSVVPGYLIGVLTAISVAALAWRFPALNGGLLALGNFMSALPIVGVAPIMVMWFGFDWHSKAAVAALITFFPMLVNAMSGFNKVDKIEHDLMYTYAASRNAYFFKLVLPASMPLLFNGLKICSTLAIIGAIVAEFFGTPVVGMGFRISSEIGRLGLDFVWATIVVSALVGTSVYGMILAIDRAVTFWDSSWR